MLRLWPGTMVFHCGHPTAVAALVEAIWGGDGKECHSSGGNVEVRGCSGDGVVNGRHPGPVGVSWAPETVGGTVHGHRGELNGCRRLGSIPLATSADERRQIL